MFTHAMRMAVWKYPSAMQGRDFAALVARIGRKSCMTHRAVGNGPHLLSHLISGRVRSLPPARVVGARTSAMKGVARHRTRRTNNGRIRRHATPFAHAPIDILAAQQTFFFKNCFKPREPTTVISVREVRHRVHAFNGVSKSVKITKSGPPHNGQHTCINTRFPRFMKCRLVLLTHHLPKALPTTYIVNPVHNDSLCEL